MKDSKIDNILAFNVVEPIEGKSRVSYSQYSLYSKCPKQWELEYKNGNKADEPSIFFTFGTSMHEVLQEWLHVLYKKSVKEADKMDLYQLLHDTMITEYTNAYKKYDKHFSTQSEIEEFFEHGCEIIDFVTKRRLDYFSTTELELVAIELPIYQQAVKGYDVYMYGFLDLVFQNKYTGHIEIWDIKTSTMGWNKWQKADKTKISQLVLYKKFLSEQYGYPLDNIDVKYFIVKRKLMEGAVFAQKRVQMFVPAHGSVTVNRVTKNFEKFIKNVFNTDGSYRDEAIFPAMAGKAAKNCKYCPFKTDFDKCPKENRHAV